MEAMTTIAKFAVNGVKNDNGTVSYAIEKGPLVNAPDDYIHIVHDVDIIYGDYYVAIFEGRDTK